MTQLFDASPPRAHGASAGDSQSWRRNRSLQRVRVVPLVGEAPTGKASASNHNAQRRGIRAASLRVRSLRRARSPQQRCEPVVALVTPGLGVNAICGVALLLQLLLDGPWSDPDRRI